VEHCIFPPSHRAGIELQRLQQNGSSSSASISAALLERQRDRVEIPVDAHANVFKYKSFATLR
jgi:hypothetical protein